MCAEDERLSFLYMPLITFMDQLTSHSLRELGWERARLPLKQWGNAREICMFPGVAHRIRGDTLRLLTKES